MRTITYLGGIHGPLTDGDVDVYRGSDPADGRLVQIRAGEHADVSDAKAAQLAEHFPGCFAVDGKTAGKRPQPPPAATSDAGGALREELLKVKRPELEAAARDLGVDAPEALPNKAALVDAILAAKQAAG